jgi:hypothetical protein
MEEEFFFLFWGVIDELSDCAFGFRWSWVYLFASGSNVVHSDFTQAPVPCIH